MRTHMTMFKTNADGTNSGGYPFSNAVNFIETSTSLSKCTRNLVNQNSSRKTSVANQSEHGRPPS